MTYKCITILNTIFWKDFSLTITHALNVNIVFCTPYDSDSRFPIMQNSKPSKKNKKNKKDKIELKEKIAH